MKIKEMFLKFMGSVKQFFKNGGSAMAWRKGSYATILTVAVALALVAANVLVTALAARFPLKTDITAQQTNSLSKENVEFIRNIENDINITVCAADAETYASYVAYYAQNGVYDGVQIIDETGRYFSQTPKLLAEYQQYNSKHIKVVYVDPSSVDFYEIAERHSDLSFNYGDILVECTHRDENGKEETRRNLITASDVYEKTSSGDYGIYYTVTGNMLETKLTTAINRVLLKKTDVIGYISLGCDPAGLLSIKSQLADNNFDLVEIKSLALDDSALSTIDTLVISAPTTDYTAEDIAKLNAFLSNDGKLGKNIIFFPDPSVGRLDNLYNFLEDHGIQMGTGTLYETDENYQVPNRPTLMQLIDAKGRFTENFVAGQRYLVSDKMVPIKIEANGENYHSLFNTTTTTVVRPYGSSSDWKPTAADVKGQYSGAALSCQLVYDDNHDYVLSNLVAFASPDFLTNDLMDTGIVANVDMFIHLMVQIHEREQDSITFLTKTVKTETFIPMEATANAMRIIFLWVLPVVLVVVAVVVFIRRKSL